MWRNRRRPADINVIGYGRDRSGRPVAVAASRHTLVTGLTGSGKGSIAGGWLKAQAPFIAKGLVQLDYIDLKGGMEAGMVNPKLIHHHAWSLSEAADLLHKLDNEVARRQDKYRGVVRMVTPDVEPRLLLMIDEAAELTIGIGKAKSEAAEATALLDSILRRGRSCGVVVVALTQDPRAGYAATSKISAASRLAAEQRGRSEDGTGRCRRRQRGNPLADSRGRARYMLVRRP